MIRTGGRSRRPPLIINLFGGKVNEKNQLEHGHAGCLDRAEHRHTDSRLDEMMHYKTVAQAAKELGLTPAAVSSMLKRLGKEKTGGIYLIDPETFDYLKSRKGKRGRPFGTTKKAK